MPDEADFPFPINRYLRPGVEASESDIAAARDRFEALTLDGRSAELGRVSAMSDGMLREEVAARRGEATSHGEADSEDSKPEGAATIPPSSPLTGGTAGSAPGVSGSASQP